jgi:hypothetical protein
MSLRSRNKYVSLGGFLLHQDAAVDTSIIVSNNPGQFRIQPSGRRSF